ncbi:MAG: IS3 family transposase [Bulleidia sp.]
MAIAVSAPHQDPDWKNDELVNEVMCIYDENHGRYGYRRFTQELQNRGYNASHKAVSRLMNLMHLR